MLPGVPIGFNLYFDDDLTNNLISVVVANGGFSVVGQALRTCGEFLSVPGSGSLSFFRNGYLVTLTEIHLTTPTTDLVSPYSIGSNGAMDTGGDFALTVVKPTNTVSGTIINSTWTASNSPYVVTGDVDVATLNIQPGVQVLFAGNYAFEVDGVLRASGTPSSPVTFSGAGWQGIFFNNCSPGSILSSCRVANSLNSGFRIWNSSAVLVNCDVVGNATLGNGGGISIQNTNPSNLQLLNSRVIGNTSVKSGAGIYAVIGANSVLNITGCIVSNNVANPSLAVEACYGAGIFVNGNSNIRYCSIRNNTCYALSGPPGGSGVAVGGGVFYTNGNSYVGNCLICSNQTLATVGGGGGASYAAGGGVFVYSGRLIMTNSIISGNIALGSTSQGGGLHIFSPAQSPNIVNCTLAYNSPEGLYSQIASAQFMNSIAYFNYSGGTQIAGTTNVTYSDVQNGFSGVGNINVNPIFISTSDPVIVPGSPCIDRGNTNAIYNDVQFPPSLGSSRNDMGAQGGPGGAWTMAIQAFPQIYPECYVEFYGGVPGYNYEIDASSDLFSWQPLEQFQITHFGDPAVYVETNSLPYRFFRFNVAH
ncbi:MAG TPA: right-handed parallel beta-helix repeat-containing protein [Verrucomicrobiae bacterium]|nr:right-handed parallel beta-helix repeat-containing protein [Verrucomicrobiae bacterium]